MSKPTYRLEMGQFVLSKEISQVHGMANIRQRYQTAGFSSEVVQILLTSWSQSTQKRMARN